MSESTGANVQPLRLLPSGGPHMTPLIVQAGRPTVVGRSRDCQVELPDPTVSRRHLTIAHASGRWVVTDLGSRHGTFINTSRLPEHESMSLESGDSLRVGPWMFRIVIGDDQVVVAQTSDTRLDDNEHVERVAEPELSRLAQHRFELLLDCAATIHSAQTERDLADAVLQSALDGTGFARAALLRPVGDAENVELIGSVSQRDAMRTIQGTVSGDELAGAATSINRPRSGGSPARPDDQRMFSRSLVRAAAGGEMSRLSRDQHNQHAMGQSIVALRITEALCAPVMSGNAVVAYLYLDAREDDAKIEPDAASFCQAIARICGLAFSNFKRVELQHRHARLESELGAARHAQQMIMPANEGAVAHVAYALECRPGSIVAGDLFDIMELDAGRVAVCIGDVSGEGIGASVIMAAAQSHLHAALLQDDDPARAVETVNRYISGRSAANAFITMWVAVIEPSGTVRFVDAGHGHWLVRRTALPDHEAAQFVSYHGGIPVGIDPRFAYATDQLELEPDDRIILYSDGVNEQMSAEGEQFGRDRLLNVIRSSHSEGDDVRRLMTAVERFAGHAQFADDTTVAALRYQPDS